MVIVPDLHQKTGFADAILARERDWDHIVFMGDYFDCFEDPNRDPGYSGMKGTVEWCNQKFHELGDQATWLLGNHDLAYLASWMPKTFRVAKNPFYSCSGYTLSKAGDFNRYAEPDWVNSLQLCVGVAEWVVVHAGFHYGQFTPCMSELDNIKQLASRWDMERKTFRNGAYHWINDVGACRGGDFANGSPIWLDWNAEFAPLEDVRQIVGHTCLGPDSLPAERAGNFCIDCYRSVYAVVTKEGELEFYRTDRPGKLTLPESR